MAENQDRDQRTERATPRKIQKARQEGQVGFSSEFAAAILIGAAVLLAFLFGTAFFSSVNGSLATRLTDFEAAILDPRMLVAFLIQDTKTFGIACLGLLVPLLLVTTIGALLQTGFNYSTKPLEFNVDKMSVIKGFGRIFSWRSTVRGALAVAKAAVICVIVYLVVYYQSDDMAFFVNGTFPQLMAKLGDLLLYTSIAVAAMMLIVGTIDLGFQKWKHLEDLRMSPKEIKDENKESEGDPMIKARIKRLQQELGRKRMLADVPKATVVITNPTHFAVALQYEPDSMEAPVVIAKGADHLARRIIEIAEENDVAVVERKPVARFLYSNVEIGSEIPMELYQAVAEVLNFVNRMRAA